MGGLGGKDGPPASYHWTAPSIIPPLIPWLAILALLMVKPNRCAQAWLIWAPLGALAFLAGMLPRYLDWLPAPLNQVYGDLTLLLGFGLAASWLLGSYLGPRHRALTFLGLLLVAGAFGGIWFGFSEDLSAADPQTWLVAIIGGMGVFVLALGLILAALFCRKRYRPMRLCGCALGMFLGLWSLIAAPFVIFALVANHGPSDWVSNLLLPLLGVVAATFLPVAAFLFLSFGNGFYRSRLQRLLKLGLESAAPPMIPSSAEVPTEVRTGAAT